ncbi:membrane protein [Chlamydia psittaci]|uniref:membrane protein n=1 Tax=Chlamydia psittaci TaxID=83554 RepID=UPI00027E154B|nr:membrane protein [Chlamydia psittaci]AFS24642.1 putative inner membrane protein [Chlamydia psittaci M56]
MFGSSPCFPGFKDNPEYVNTHFYCSCCKGVVQPREVSVLVVGSDGKASGIAPILRCQSHLIDGMCCSGPITTLWGLYPKDEEAVRIHEKMKSVYFRVRNLDICALLNFIGAGILFFSGVILGVIVASPVIPGMHHWFFPVILLGVGLILCLIGAIFSYFSKARVREWLDLSQHYVQHCELVHVQAGTEKYVVLTEFPPSCHLLDPILAAPQLHPAVLPLPIPELIPVESASSFS